MSNLYTYGIDWYEDFYRAFLIKDGKIIKYSQFYPTEKKARMVAMMMAARANTGAYQYD